MRWYLDPTTRRIDTVLIEATGRKASASRRRELLRNASASCTSPFFSPHVSRLTLVQIPGEGSITVKPTRLIRVELKLQELPPISRLQGSLLTVLYYISLRKHHWMSNATLCLKRWCLSQIQAVHVVALKFVQENAYTSHTSHTVATRLLQ